MLRILLCVGLTVAVAGHASAVNDILRQMKLVPSSEGLVIQSLRPGGSSVFERGDTLRFVTAPEHPVYSAQTVSHLEEAQKAIGLNTTAYIEVLRNGRRRFLRFGRLDGEDYVVYDTSDSERARELFDGPGAGGQGGRRGKQDAGGSVEAGFWNESDDSAMSTIKRNTKTKGEFGGGGAAVAPSKTAAAVDASHGEAQVSLEAVETVRNLLDDIGRDQLLRLIDLMQ